MYRRGVVRACGSRRVFASLINGFGNWRASIPGGREGHASGLATTFMRRSSIRPGCGEVYPCRKFTKAAGSLSRALLHAPACHLWNGALVICGLALATLRRNSLAECSGKASANEHGTHADRAARANQEAANARRQHYFANMELPRGGRIAVSGHLQQLLDETEGQRVSELGGGTTGITSFPPGAVTAQHLGTYIPRCHVSAAASLIPLPVRRPERVYEAATLRARFVISASRSGSLPEPLHFCGWQADPLPGIRPPPGSGIRRTG